MKAIQLPHDSLSLPVQYRVSSAVPVTNLEHKKRFGKVGRIQGTNDWCGGRDVEGGNR